MLFGAYSLRVPKRIDLGDELLCRSRGRKDPVVMVVEDEGDRELTADREEVVDVVAHLHTTVKIRRVMRSETDTDLIVF